MKKLLYMTLLALVAVVTGCSTDYAYPPVIMGDVKGDGTAESPYNVAKAIRVAAANGETSDVAVFTAGYVVSGSIDTSYGNATWDICDTPDGSGQKLIVYRAKDFDNKKFTDASKVKEGDYIVVYAPLINFRGNTPETGSGAYLYAINGQVGSTIPDQPAGPVEPSTPKGNGTVDEPYNVAKAIEVAKANGATSDVNVYTEGYVISGSIDTAYGNGTWVICDNAEGTASQITVYRCKDFNNQKFTDTDKVKVGDKIVVYAPIINYGGNTPETNLGYLYSINGSAGSEPAAPDTPASGQGTEDNPYSVQDVIGGATGSASWVKGYIVGWIDGKTLSDGAKFNGQATVATNVLIADSPETTDVSKCVPVQLPTGAVRDAINLQSNPGNYKKQVCLQGSLEKYFGAPGIKTVTAYKLDGASSPSTPDTPATGDVIYTSLVSNADGWTFNNVVMNDPVTYIWKWDTQYNNLKASAYVNNANNAADSYATVAVDLSGYTKASVSFDHAYKFGADVKTSLTCVVRPQGTEAWTVLTIPTWPTGQDWTFVNSGSIDLGAFAGRKIEIGFRYISTTSAAATWEIKNFNVSATK